MEIQEIEVFINPDGTVRIEVRGVEGMQCLDLTKELEDALGGEIEAREMRPEAYESHVQDEQEDQNRQQRRLGQ